MARRWAAAAVALLLTASGLTGQTIAEAQQLQAQNDWLGAEGVWQKLAAQTPADHRLWTSLGIALAHQEKFPEAIAAYRKALRLSPKDPQTNWNLGLALFKSRRLPEAIAPLQTGAARLPESPQVQTVLGMCLFGAGRFGEAVPYLEKVEHQTGDTQVLQTLAQSYLYSGQYEKASEALSTLAQSNPDSPENHMFLGEAEDGAGHLEKAIAEFRLATAQGSLPNSHFGLGYLLWKDRSYPQAADEFRSELRLDPRHAQALCYLGDVELKGGQTDQAERHLRQSVESRDAFWLTHLDLGIIEAGRKDWKAAEHELLRAATLNPARSEPHYRLAQIYKANGQTEQAKTELQRVTALHRNEEDKLVREISGDPPHR